MLHVWDIELVDGTYEMCFCLYLMVVWTLTSGLVNTMNGHVMQIWVSTSVGFMSTLENNVQKTAYGVLKGDKVKNQANRMRNKFLFPV